VSLVREHLCVLHVTQPTGGGVASHVASLAEAQIRHGWSVAVASPLDSAFAGRVTAAGARHLAWVAGREPGRHTLGEVRPLAQIVAAVRPDVVHLHSSKAGLAGRLAVRGRRPTVFQPHAWSFEAVDGLVGRAALAWERGAARWADVIVCVSEGERQRGEEMGVRARFQVIRNGVDLNALPAASPKDREEARRRLGLDTAAPLAVCVGRLSRQKGQDILLEAWPAVRERVPEAKLALVGSGPDADALRLEAGPGVELTGERDDVPDWLAAADLVVQPSRWEGMSLALLEAMARGRSVVATDVPGTAETLADVAGAVVPVDSPGPLADAVAARLLDPARAAAEAVENRRRAEQFDLNRTTAAFVEVYRELLEARSPRHLRR
jgi:glycosyltransferase involved in cell wall biosynthesis